MHDAQSTHRIVRFDAERESLDSLDVSRGEEIVHGARLATAPVTTVVTSCGAARRPSIRVTRTTYDTLSLKSLGSRSNVRIIASGGRSSSTICTASFGAQLVPS